MTQLLRVFGRPRPAVFAAACLLSASLAAAPAAQEEAPDFKKLEADLKKAIATKQFARAALIVDRLAAPGELEGYRVILRHAVAGHDYTLDRRAGAHLVRVKDPAVRKEILGTLRDSRNPRTKIILLAVAARWDDDPEALKAIADTVRNERRSKAVIFAALSWIRKLKRPEVFAPPLVEELAERERRAHDRVYYDILKTLKEITGEDLELSSDWRNYLEALRKGGPKARKPTRGRTVLVRTPSFFSVVVASDRVYFVIDVSTSMNEEDLVTIEPEKEKETGGTTVVGRPKRGGAKVLHIARIERVKEELIRTIQALPQHVHFGILAFSHELKFFRGKGMLFPATPGVKAEAVDWVRRLTPNGATRTDLALEAVLRNPEVDTIMLLTDGAPRDERNQRIPPERVLAYVKELNRFRKVRIHTIGFSQAGVSMRRFVQELARQNDGRCVLLE